MPHRPRSKLPAQVESFGTACPAMIPNPRPGVTWFTSATRELRYQTLDWPRFGACDLEVANDCSRKNSFARVRGRGGCRNAQNHCHVLRRRPVRVSAVRSLRPGFEPRIFLKIAAAETL